jgi:mono/diheme cytochrome c family protein
MTHPRALAGAVAAGLVLLACASTGARNATAVTTAPPAEASPAATAAPPTPTDPEVAYGGRLFRIYCQSCHGEHGRGDGPVARELRLDVQDLRRLAAREPGGRFPAERVEAVIDGREPVAGHGPSEMPVWGLTFLDPGRVADQESDVEERIRSLVAFLRNIQEAG